MDMAYLELVRDKLQGIYDVETEIGSGAHGFVYRAVHKKSGTLHALKVLKPGVDREQANRFVRESKIMSRFEADDIVTVYESGEIGGIRFIGMEFIEGQTLRSLLDDGASFSPDQVVEIGKTLSMVLGLAHGKGIIHRDVKPENIMIRSNGAAVLTDFGIARDNLDDGLTENQATLGTRAYMAPELLSGKSKGAPDPTVDVWSLGMVLYELATGRRPFNTHGPELMNDIISKPIPRPMSINVNIPPELDEIITKCLHQVPSSRFETCMDLAVKLDPGRRVGEFNVRPKGLSNQPPEGTIHTSSTSGSYPSTSGGVRPAARPNPNKLIGFGVYFVAALLLLTVVAMFAGQSTLGTIMDNISREPGAYGFGAVLCVGALGVAAFGIAEMIHGRDD